MVHLFNLIISHPPSLKSFTRSRTVYALRPSKPARAKARNKLIINNLTSPPTPHSRRVTGILQTSQCPFRLPPTPLKAISASTDAFLQNLSATLGDTIAWHQRQQYSILRPLKINHLHQCSPPQKVFVKSLPFLGRAAFKAYLCASLNGEAISLAFGFNILS